MNITEQHKWKELVVALKTNATSQRVTHQEIANKIGVKRSNISRFFSCKHCPSLEMFTAVAEALDIEVNLFFLINDTI